jgi:hypothetical protein
MPVFQTITTSNDPWQPPHATSKRPSYAGPAITNRLSAAAGQLTLTKHRELSWSSYQRCDRFELHRSNADNFEAYARWLLVQINIEAQQELIMSAGQGARLGRRHRNLLGPSHRKNFARLPALVLSFSCSQLHLPSCSAAGGFEVPAIELAQKPLACASEPVAVNRIPAQRLALDSTYYHFAGDEDEDLFPDAPWHPHLTAPFKFDKEAISSNFYLQHLSRAQYLQQQQHGIA